MGKGSAAESRKGKNPCEGVCDGKGACWVNTLCSPCVLPARSCLDRLKFPESGANATSCFFMTPEDASERYCRAPLIEPA